MHAKAVLRVSTGNAAPNGVADDDEIRLNARKAYPKALIMAPTRELASQIYEESRKFAYQTGLRSVVCYGGAPAGFQVCPGAAAPWCQQAVGDLVLELLAYLMVFGRSPRHLALSLLMPHASSCSNTTPQCPQCNTLANAHLMSIVQLYHSAATW